MTQRTMKSQKRKSEGKSVATHHKALPGLGTESTINPKTGRVWSLTDPEVRGRVKSLEAELRDPGKAEEFLKRSGFLTAKTGKLTKRYGG